MASVETEGTPTSVRVGHRGARWPRFVLYVGIAAAVVALLLVLPGLLGTSSEPRQAAEPPAAFGGAPELSEASIRSWLRVTRALQAPGIDAQAAARVLREGEWTADSYAFFRGGLEFGLFGQKLHEDQLARLESVVEVQRKFVETVTANPDAWANPDPEIRAAYTRHEAQKLQEMEERLERKRSGKDVTEEGWRNYLLIREFESELREVGLDGSSRGVLSGPLVPKPSSSAND